MPPAPPAFPRRYTPAEQAGRERELERLTPAGIPSRKAYEGLPRRDRSALRARARTAAVRLFSTPKEAEGLRGFFDECELTTDEFVRMADSFDSAISDCDIQQALRNQWVFNSIQCMLGLPASLTPSSFAYSLLYPYTDNMLDGALPAGADKKRFLFWLSQRLDGRVGPLPGPRAKAVSWLLRLIEEEYPRSRFPLVHESLRAIHRAQEKSLRLHHPVNPADNCALTPLTIEKGGTSVLVDGFLAAGRPDHSALDALFGYGVLLQLIDDLQDLDEDAAAGHSTPFGRAAAMGPLDPVTNRLFHLARAVICALQRLGGPRRPSLFGLIEQSCLLQILSAVALHADHFTPSYLAAAEEVTPLSFAFIRKSRKLAPELPESRNPPL